MPHHYTAVPCISVHVPVYTMLHAVQVFCCITVRVLLHKCIATMHCTAAECLLLAMLVFAGQYTVTGQAVVIGRQFNWYFSSYKVQCYSRRKLSFTKLFVL